jgi:ubiquinone/menaquinone biosynthesis C-methylase UbiE
VAGEPGLGLVTPASKVPWGTKNASNHQRTRGTPGVIRMDQGNTIKKDVQEFYDNIGWDKSDDGFSDASIYEDLRPVAAEYIHRCHQRVKQHLPDSGRYLLDVASGPVQYNDYVAYSAGYERRVCADISLRALVEARRRLGDKGLYVVADIANLPFADNSFDGVVSLHTIYHVPAAEQEKAFNEIHRVLAAERPAVVVYSWGARSPLMLVSLMPFQVWNWLSRRMRARTVSQGGSDSPALYGHHYGYSWFASRKWPFTYELYSWRSVSPDFTKIYVRRWLFGRSLLSQLFRMENAWPRFFGRFGQYPMIVFRKNPSA